MTYVEFDRIKIGDTITARSWDGTMRRGIVNEVEEDIKNGRSGCAYGDYWCYMDQIVGHEPA